MNLIADIIILQTLVKKQLKKKSTLKKPKMHTAVTRLM